MVKKSIYRLCIILIALLINACSLNQSNISSNPILDWPQHQQELKQLTAFQASGSLAYFDTKSRYYGRFYIKQLAKNEYQLKLTSPIGTSIFSLSVNPFEAVLTDKNGEKYRNKNVESLVEDLTGMNIPLRNMTDWLIGYANNNDDKIDDSGKLSQTHFKQTDKIWTVTYRKYTDVKFHSNTIDLPSTIFLNSGRSELRLSINNWKIL